MLLQKIIKLIYWQGWFIGSIVWFAECHHRADEKCVYAIRLHTRRAKKAYGRIDLESEEILDRNRRKLRFGQ